jgi:soluble lytic murein transglycosylase
MNDDREVRCYALAATFASPNQSLNQIQKPETAAEIKKLWHAFRDVEEGCTYAAEKLYEAKKLDALDLWLKARLAMDNNRPRPAQDALNIESNELGKQAALIHADPQKYLDKRIVAFTRKRKELSVLALIRIANNDPDKAAELIEKKMGLDAQQRRAQLDMGRHWQASGSKTTEQRAPVLQQSHS